MKLPSILIIIGLFFHTVAHADLSKLALFSRCYTQITSQPLTVNQIATDPLVLKVVAGTISPVDACMTILNSAQLSGANPALLINPSDTRAQSILATFHRLHASWFYSKDFPTVSWPGHASDMKDLYDSTSPALYLTRALFSPGVSASDPITSTDFLQANRTTASPAVGPETGHPTSDFIFTTGFSFAATGTLLGVQLAPTSTLNYMALNNSHPAGSIAPYSTIGGGYLGTQTYLSLNLSPLSSYSVYATDGGVHMHRHFGKAVFNDTLCRDLPVVRESDAISFVDTQSSIPFRNSSACVKCHASHDRLSATVRGMYVQYVGSGDPTAIGQQSRGGIFAQFHPVTMAAETAWPTTPDANYSNRPQNGVLFFRDYNGNLVNESVTGLSDLGQKIANTDDYYICLAKRYYAYFTGIQVDTGDLADPAHGAAGTSADALHRQTVVNLGKALHKNQSLPLLIKSILSLDTYQKTDFGVKAGGSGS